MSSKRLYATLAIFCLTLAVVGVMPAVADEGTLPAPAEGSAVVAPDQPNADADIVGQLDQRGENRCIQITVWAQNLQTGECQEFSSPCSVPEGWTLYFDPATCTNW